MTRHIRGILLDLNGTLHVGHDPTPGAVDALRKLRKLKIPFVFCSNTTKESSKSLLRKLRGMGFELEDRELMTSLGACRQIVDERGLNPFLILSPSAKEEFRTHSPPYDSVIIGLHEASLSYPNLNTAFRILKGEPLKNGSSTSATKKPVLLAPHLGLYQHLPATDDHPEGLSLGPGAFIRGLESAAEVKAEVVGKPTRRYFELAIARLDEIHHTGVADVPGEVYVVGDDVDVDLGGGALELGLKRVLVRTGTYRSGAEDRIDPPQMVCDSFAAFVDSL